VHPKFKTLFSLYLSLVFWAMDLFDLSITKLCFKFVNVAKVEFSNLDNLKIEIMEPFHLAHLCRLNELNFGKEYLWDQKLRQLGITWGHT
jgi:hypothetical protein